jgi:hypothetical protein
MASTLIDHLRALPDSALVALLGRRPDLVTPPPSDIAALAARAQSRVSVARALDGLDLFTLEILDACRLAQDQASGDGATLTGILALAADVDGAVVLAAVQRLRDLAIVYGSEDALFVVAAVDEVSSPYPAGLGRPAALLDSAAGELAADPALLRRELLAAGPAGRAVLDRLAAGPPIGTASPETVQDITSTVGALVDRHLLVAVSDDTVELPREVAIALRRDGLLGPLHPHAPTSPGPSRAGKAVDSAGAGQVMEVVRHAEDVLAELADEPAQALRTGGVGIRDLRRVARAAGIDESVAAVLLEVTAAAGLLGETDGATFGSTGEPRFLPTLAYDQWLEASAAQRWIRLARAWLAMTRQPGAATRRATTPDADVRVASDEESVSDGGVSASDAGLGGAVSADEAGASRTAPNSAAPSSAAPRNAVPNGDEPNGSVPNVGEPNGGVPNGGVPPSGAVSDIGLRRIGDSSHRAGRNGAAGRGVRRAVASVLGPDLERTGAPRLRSTVLNLLAAGAPTENHLLASLHWQAPRRSPWQPGTADPSAADPVRWILTEAALLGIIASGGPATPGGGARIAVLTSYGRLLLDDATAAAADPDGDPLGLTSSAPAAPSRAVAVLDKLLPPPVDHILVQADLSVVVPGRPETGLAAELALVADHESAGGASVYRVTRDSIRRALDAGHSATDLHAMFTRRSRTPVPQALTYLIDDVSRRHGGLRLGAAGCYLRSEDVALLTEVATDRRLAGLALRVIAPTVVVTPYLVSRVLDELRSAGYAPVQEDVGGGLVIARTRAFRAPPRRNTLSYATVADSGRAPTGPRLAAAVEAMRRGDVAARRARRGPDSVRSPAADTHAHTQAMAVLQQAIRDKSLVWVGYVDPHGATMSRLLRPVSIGAGYLRAQDERTDTLHTFALHRITAAVVDD